MGRPRRLSRIVFWKRLDETKSPRRGRSPWLVAAACALLLGVWLVPSKLRERAVRRENAQRLEMMRNEYRALRFELDELRALTFEGEPVLELGGTEQLDFVIDLRRLGEAQGARTRPTVHTPK